MFILRRIDPENGQINTNLGDYYTLIFKERNGTSFFDTVKEWDMDTVSRMYGVIVYEDGSSMMPLYHKSTYYIMTSDGRTFDNVSAGNIG